MEKAMFEVGQKVDFYCFDFEGDRFDMTGEILVVDAYGTFLNPDDVCYDIRVPEMKSVFKHVPQKFVIKAV